MSRACPVIVMAKAPVPGYAKTRLIPALGELRAAALAERLLEHALDQALAADIGPVDLCCAPDRLHPAFARQATRKGIELSVQGEGDLGARMQRAFARWLAQGMTKQDMAQEGMAQQGMALMIGTDAPALDAAILRRAAAALAEHDAVFVPALDGGYALIGLRRPAPRLFDSMPWSTAEVMARTRERLAESGLSHAELPPLPDIDNAADLVHLPPGWSI